MEPASSIIARFGGVSAVARIVGRHRTRVSNWMRAKDAGGTGGTIPSKAIPVLLAAAKQHGVELTAADFFPADPSTEPAQ